MTALFVPAGTRVAAELAFRGSILRRLCGVGAVILCLLALNGVLWFRLQRGVVIASSKNPKTGELIMVRDLLSSNPFWAASFSQILDDHHYRCEYYKVGVSGFVSAQIYDDRGYKVGSARIDWRDDNSATVYFGDASTLICNQGWWSKAPPR